jgi:ribosomal protein L29
MKDLIKKTEKELKTLLVEKRAALRNFRFSVSGSNVRNVKEGKALKKDIARVLTLINKQLNKKIAK